MTNKDREYLKANRKGSRDAELEMEYGWTQKNKIHRSRNAYKRKSKHREKFI